MGDLEVAAIVAFLMVLIMYFRLLFISSFKEAYYKEKLRNRDVDTSHIDDIGIIGILKL
jgi:hypothetical protein